jgi:hypothetical protein
MNKLETVQERINSLCGENDFSRKVLLKIASRSSKDFWPITDRFRELEFTGDRIEMLYNVFNESVDLMVAEMIMIGVDEVIKRVGEQKDVKRHRRNGHKDNKERVR